MSPEDSEQDFEDLTRKQRREKARTQRRAAEEAEASAAVRRKRVMQLGGVAVAVIVIIAVIIAVTGSKGSSVESSVPQTKSARNAVVHEVRSLLAGIPQAGATLGKPNAPITIQYYGDLECPFCRDFSVNALSGLIAKEVRTGKVKIEYRSLSTATGGAESDGAEPSGTFLNQQVAAYAAGKQNLGWYYIELFYHEQGEEDTGYVTESYLQKLAQQVPGMDLKQWQADRSDTTLENQVIEDEREAGRIGFKGTPSFMLGKTGGKLTPAFTELSPETATSAEYEAEIDKLTS